MTSESRPTERVAAHIDGFSLYFGIRREGRRHLWLDLEALMRSLLKPRQRLVAVRYFTAMVRDDPAAEQRQKTYLNALAVSLVEDRITGLFGTALLVSADSDMAPGIRRCANHSSRRP